MRFTLIEGKFRHGAQHYIKGDTVISDLSLDKMFANQFKRIEEDEASVETSVVRKYRVPKKLTVATCLWGTWSGGSGIIHANRLFRMLTRHCSFNFRFVLFLDAINWPQCGDLVDGIEARVLDVPSWEGCLPKMWCYNPANGIKSGRVIVMDLDTVIVGDIDEMFSYGGKFISRKDELSPHHAQSGGGMQGFAAGSMAWAWDMFVGDPAAMEVNTMLDGTPACERQFIRRYVADGEFWADVYPGHMQHYARQLLKRNRLQRAYVVGGKMVQYELGNSRVVVFSGAPKLHELPKTDPLRRYWEDIDDDVVIGSRLKHDTAHLLGMVTPLRRSGVKLLTTSPSMVDATLADAGDSTVATVPRRIVVEKVDGAQVRSRDELKSDRVIGMLKSYTFRDGQHNAPSVDGRRHCGILANAKTSSVIPLDAAAISKIRVIAGFGSTESVRALKGKCSFETERPIDVHFAGTTEYSSKRQNEQRAAQLITTTRIRCSSGLWSFAVAHPELRVVLRTSRSDTRLQYDTELLQSKVVVSPWGWGEACFRDYEAMAAGAVLVKPDSGYVLGDPDIFNYGSALYEPCAPDFSNLEEVLLNILSNYDQFLSMRQRALKVVQACWDDELLGRNVATAIKSIIHKKTVADTTKAFTREKVTA